MVDFYDRQGQAALYIDNTGTIYEWNGRPVGFQVGENLYRSNGQFAARLNQGWMRDNYGHGVLFSNGATGGPIPPIPRIAPIKAIPQIPPIRGIAAIAPIHAIPSFNWSQMTYNQLF